MKDQISTEVRHFPCAIERHKYRGELMDLEPVCAYCGESVTWKRSTLDHVIPTSRGGEDSTANVLLCCRPCNNSKGDRTLDEWIEDLETARAKFIGDNAKSPLNQIAEALARYHQELVERQHGGLAQNRFVSACEDILGKQA